MAVVRIPFREQFKTTLLNGTKVCTSRTRRMGKEGDRFEAFGSYFLIERIHHIPLEAVKALWKEEGCRSTDDFVQVWNDIHPNKKFNSDQLIYLHWFRKEGIG
jgi:hypothetical protein